VWSHDGNTLYFETQGKLFEVSLIGTSPLRVSEPREVLDLDGATVFGIGPDGRFIAQRGESRRVTRLEVIVNFHREVAERLTTR